MKKDTTPKTGKDQRVHALIPAAGRGVRFGSVENKIFAMIGGKPIIRRTLDCFAEQVDTITIVGQKIEIGRIEDYCSSDRPVQFTIGGATRQESVLAGLRAVNALDEDIVLVHDGARPFLSPQVIKRVTDAASKYGCAIAALPLSDTIKAATSEQFIQDTRDRNSLWAAQTPQGGRLGLLRESLENAARLGVQCTDEAGAVEKFGAPVKLVMGSRENIKITTQEDIDFAEVWLTKAPPLAIRIGTGYDIHRLVPGRDLFLGGVKITSEVGLLGHSDADVLLHAICDALLGAAALPDIGNLFPNTDPKFAGISSMLLLEEVRERLALAGYRVGNIDCCIVAEQPKIAPYTQQMRANIAAGLDTNLSNISVKATTNEGLGSLGAGEGIACHASATILMMK